MATLSVPLSGEMEEFIKRMVDEGVGSNKADVVRRALREYAENQAYERILRARKEYTLRLGKEGDLRDLMKEYE